ncbi:hypothetical protein FJY68_05995 [candidate division WOR-3 bacterium]|uniref:Peptidase A2 domain-containing protein n=1 Tax=candidate division WOR-3 bacterium TaxID=2052148 RepID=A0A938BPQ3_UNCW3|nr:hypothetical protein [candidate division WOR-3 bacterium]
MKKPHPSALALVAPTLVCITVACASRPITARAEAATGEIPFEMRGGTVMVPVKIGQSRLLRLVLDTGMYDGVLLYEPIPDSTFPGPVFEVRIPGAGDGDPARGRMSDSGTFKAGTVEFRNQRVIWLTDGLMDGFGGDGVIGTSLLGHWVVEIDYDRKVIKLHESEFRPDSTWTMLPMVVHRVNTPWVKTRVSLSGEEPQELDSYIDLADNAEFILLVSDSSKFQVPEDAEPVYLGRGLSGDVYGHKGRAALVRLDTHQLKDIAIGFAPDRVRSKQPGAEAVIGGSLLARFNTIYDYAGGRLYVKRRAD